MSFSIDNKSFVTVKSDGINLMIRSALKDYSVLITEESAGIKLFRDLFDNDLDILLIDSIVYELYKNNFDLCLNARVFVVEAIEDNKTLDKSIEVLNFLSELKFTKAGTVYAVGGGIVQDIAAFVGATFKRGINWILYPTTLLSMSDSCIGSKSSINFQGNKNQLGLFSAPDKIIIDITFLRTLKDRELYSGLGEVLKLHLIGGNKYFHTYSDLVCEGTVKNFSYYNQLIMNSLLIKKSVIEEDEFDKTYRRALNYGHTFGHVLESLSNYTIPHGQAIAAGMLLANALGGSLDNGFNKSIKDLIFPEYWQIIKALDEYQIFEHIKSDKKVVGNTLNIVFLQDIGTSKIEPILLDQKFLARIRDILNL